MALNPRWRSSHGHFARTAAFIPVAPFRSGPDQREFHLSALGGSDWHQIAEPVTLSLTTRIEHARMSHWIAELYRVDLGQNLRERFLALLPWLDSSTPLPPGYWKFRGCEWLVESEF